MRVPKACFAKDLGYVVLDDDNRKAYRVLNTPTYNLILSDFYKQKEGDFWLKVRKTEDNSDLLKDDSKFKTVEVEYLDHVIYWTEMSFEDIKKSLLFLCDISKYLADNNVHMTSHLWNVTLRNGNPILIDLGDFRPGVALGAIFETIVSTLSEKVTHHVPLGFQPHKWIDNSYEILNELQKIKSNIGKTINNSDHLIEETRSVLSKIKVRDTHIHWDTYPVQKNMPTTVQEVISYAENNRPNLCKIIKEKSPKTLLDLGCSYGLYSFYAACLGASVTGVDYSHKMISEANNRSMDIDVDYKFGFIDLLNVKSWGMDGSYGSYYDRLKSEGVIAPALLHHVHGRGKSLEKIIEEWCSCAKKWIVIEHIPNDTMRGKIDSNKVVEVLKGNGFDKVSFLDSKPSPRKWILGEKVDTNL